MSKPGLSRMTICLRLIALVGIFLILDLTTSRWRGAASGISYLRSEPLEKQTNVPLKNRNQFEMTLNRIESKTPDDGNVTKAIVAPMMPQDDLTWIPNFLPDWHAYIYAVQTAATQHAHDMSSADEELDSTASTLSIGRNKGREAAVYLTFLIDHYHTLPDIMVFLHGKRYQWHNDDPMYDGLPLLLDLRLAHVQKAGYASLRCTWGSSCPAFLHPDASLEDGFFDIDGAFAKTFAEFFPAEDVPGEVGAGCCAQFAVSAEQVRARPLADYVRYRSWLWTTELSSEKSGYIMEYMWHMIFGHQATHCPSAQACFCDTFGYCDLECPNEDSCEGRFWERPWGKEFPTRWPEEGQGVDGWPREGWWLPESKKSWWLPKSFGSKRNGRALAG